MCRLLQIIGGALRVNILLAGYFCMLFLLSAEFFQNEHSRMTSGCGSRLGPAFCQAWSGSQLQQEESKRSL